jgi:hypothetical protein
MNLVASDELNLEDHRQAFSEVAFLLDAFSATIDATLGGATAPVGRLAGRAMARKLPVHLDHPSLEEVLELLRQRLAAGFSFSCSSSGDTTELTFDKCVLRQACVQRALPVGGPMCRLFHAYFDGIVNELISRPVKSDTEAGNPSCLIRLRTQ